MNERLKTGSPGGVSGARELHSDVRVMAPRVGGGVRRDPFPSPAKSGDVKKPFSGV